MAKRTVNLNTLEPFLAPGIFTRISPDVEESISRYPEFNERIKGCVSFCHQLGSDYPNKQKTSDRRKYIRAALAEFVSLEDAAKIDCGEKADKGSLGILSTDDARLHVVRLLRHANVHLAACDIGNTSRPATWDGPDGVVKFDFQVFYIPNIRQSIESTDQASKYSSQDLDSMISWIEREQMEWGISHLVLRSAELYARMFINKCT